MSVAVLDVVNGLKSTIEAMDAFTGKVIFVYDDDDLTNKIKGLSTFPAIGIVYEGMRAVPALAERNASSKMGLSGEIVVSIVLITTGDALAATATTQVKTNALTLLDTLRKNLLATRSPTQHYWRFMVEAPAKVKNGMVYWVQRWSTPVNTMPSALGS